MRAASAIAGDGVDRERLARAWRRNIARIRNFTILSGLNSTGFDLATFALLRPPPPGLLAAQ